MQQYQIQQSLMSGIPASTAGATRSMAAPSPYVFGATQSSSTNAANAPGLIPMVAPPFPQQLPLSGSASSGSYFDYSSIPGSKSPTGTSSVFSPGYSSQNVALVRSAPAGVAPATASANPLLGATSLSVTAGSAQAAQAAAAAAAAAASAAAAAQAAAAQAAANALPPGFKVLWFSCFLCSFGQRVFVSKRPCLLPE